MSLLDDSFDDWAFRQTRLAAIQFQKFSLEQAFLIIADAINSKIDGEQLKKGYLENLRQIEVELNQTKIIRGENGN